MDKPDGSEADLEELDEFNELVGTKVIITLDDARKMVYDKNTRSISDRTWVTVTPLTHPYSEAEQNAYDLEEWNNP